MKVLVLILCIVSHFGCWYCQRSSNGAPIRCGGASTLKQIWLNILPSARWDSFNASFSPFLLFLLFSLHGCQQINLHCCSGDVLRGWQIRHENSFCLFSFSFYEIRIEPSISGGWQFRKWGFEKVEWRHQLITHSFISDLAMVNRNWKAVQLCSFSLKSVNLFSSYERYPLHLVQLRFDNFWKNINLKSSLCVWRQGIALSFLVINKSQDFTHSTSFQFYNLQFIFKNHVSNKSCEPSHA